MDLTAESNGATPSYADPQRETGNSRTSSFQEADLLHSLPLKRLIEPLAAKHHREKGNLMQPNPLIRIQGLKVYESTRPIFDQIFGRTFIFKLWALKRTARLEEGQVSKQQMAAEMAISPSLREKMRQRFERNLSYLKPRPLSTITLVWKENARIYYAYSFFKQ
ncbi:MAG: hypothetical protein ACE5HO_10250 [bacterium]